jgi:hypothetical protein
MVPKSQIDQTIERFQERTPEHQQTEAKLTTGSPLTGNDPALVEQRLARIMAVEGARVALSPVEAAVAAPVTVNVLERVLGNNDLIGVTFLESACQGGEDSRSDSDSIRSADGWLWNGFPRRSQCPDDEQPLPRFARGCGALA